VSVIAITKPNLYKDSLALMQIAQKLLAFPGVRRATLVMGTPANKEILAEAKLLAEPVAAAGPGDLILVIDADLHRPSVAEYLGIAPPHSPGLSDAILGESSTLELAIRRIEPFNLSVVLAGSEQSGAYELLNSPRLDLLLTNARNDFDYIIVDTPPVVPLPDSRLLARCVDGFLIVVAAHKTPRKVLAEALTLVDSTKTIGLVFNGDDRPLSPYSSYYGYYGNQDGASRRHGQSCGQRPRSTPEKNANARVIC